MRSEDRRSWLEEFADLDPSTVWSARLALSREHSTVGVSAPTTLGDRDKSNEQRLDLKIVGLISDTHIPSRAKTIPSTLAKISTSLSPQSLCYMRCRFTKDFKSPKIEPTSHGVCGIRWLKLVETLGTANALTAKLNSTFTTKTRPYPSAVDVGVRLPTKK